MFFCHFLVVLNFFIISQCLSQLFRKPSYSISKIIASLLISIDLNSINGYYNNNVGVDNLGLFHPCPPYLLQPSCVSSQDDRPPYFLEPWCYDGSMTTTLNNLLQTLTNLPGATINSENSDSQAGRYIHVTFHNSDNTIDETEFYFTPNDNTIQFRSFRKDGSWDNGTNRKRVEKIRQQLSLEYVPVLRNRRRVLFFMESPFDTFGPPTILFDQLIDEVSGDQSSKVQ
jgi:uncharacterized protein (DUF1499 family)